MPVPLGYPDPDYPEYEQLAAAARERARRQHSVDPSNLTPESDAISRRGNDWARAVLGFWYQGPSWLSRWHQELLLLADEHNISPPLPAEIAEARAKEAAETEERRRARDERQGALDAEWKALIAALPVQVAVAHNFKSHRHCENGYVQGADHIITQEPFAHGRMARLRHQALCETKSNSHNLLICFPEGESDGSTRWPTCKACIRIACKVTGLDAPTMLGQPHANGGGGIPNRVWTARTRAGRRWPR